MKKPIAIILSLLLGGLFALFVLLCVCMAMDAIAQMTTHIEYASTAAGRSGDSVFGNSAAVLLLVYGPWAWLAGTLLLSYPIYYFCFKKPIAAAAPAQHQLVFCLLSGALMGVVAANYLDGRFLQGAYWGAVVGLVFALPAVWLRSGARSV